ncbi:hypothetical protein, partial [Paenibacillus sp. P32E]|uniref:hypothetical protein n=1 Tax=Paenibacillus sp. P32E TaxID=1349434 RepID=UPI001C4A0F3C
DYLYHDSTEKRLVITKAQNISNCVLYEVIKVMIQNIDIRNKQAYLNSNLLDRYVVSLFKLIDITYEKTFRETELTREDSALTRKAIDILLNWYYQNYENIEYPKPG